MGLTPQSHLVQKVLEKSRAIPVLALMACVAYKKGENLPILIKKIYMFRTDLLSIIRSLITVFTAIGICHIVC